MKVKAATEQLVVIDLERVKNEWVVQLDQGTADPKVVRVYKDHVEIDVEIESSYSARRYKKTLKIWFHDMLLMNETLYRIHKVRE